MLHPDQHFQRATIGLELGRMHGDQITQKKMLVLNLRQVSENRRLQKVGLIGVTAIDNHRRAIGVSVAISPMKLWRSIFRSQ
ncbi:hypothetical protein [Brevundimonas sp. C43]|uniref:hypothetical protein n=1 Tax=Brevundimonas sp. C43 TaxID=3068314 RepID=UPI00273F1741|nr:hypothetical protein [Brevundimonas sp. C43]